MRSCPGFIPINEHRSASASLHRGAEGKCDGDGWASLSPTYTWLHQTQDIRTCFN